MRVFLNNFFLLTTVVTSTISNGQFLRNKQNHKIKELSNSDIRHLARLSDTRHVDEMLDHILVPRVVSTASHDRVYEFIKRQLTNLDWDVDVDEFKDRTPFGELTFKNIIGTLNPQAERFLVLSCHYDSKYFQNDEFLGATDSAVPCAMLLNMAKVMKTELDSLDPSSDLGLKFIFFDGEEAFVEWGPSDSIYGARHLAKLYADNLTRSKTSGETVSGLDRMDVFVLLDLLGTRNPNFVSFHRSTEQLFVRLVEIEEKLDSLNLLQNHRNKQYFKRKRSSARIEDDHIPFLQKNVPILHLIPTPFPSVWHTIDDDRSVVDMDTVENLNKILRVFVAEYLHLSLLDRPAGKEEDPHHEL